VAPDAGPELLGDNVGVPKRNPAAGVCAFLQAHLDPGDLTLKSVETIFGKRGDFGHPVSLGA
jgi:hypothetical protein